MRQLLCLFGLALILTQLSACDTDSPTVSVAPPLPIPVAQEMTLVASCNSCHGSNGVGVNPAVPFIAGQPAAYLEASMRAYLIGDRQHQLMRAAVFDLEVSERHQLAEHFAQLKTPWITKTRHRSQDDKADNMRAIRGGQILAKTCAGCHGTDGNSIKSGVPSLAGLQPEYFIPSLKSYLQGQRRGAAIMKNFKLSLSDRDIKQLAAFFAAQKRVRSPLGAKLNPADASDSLAHRCLGCHGDDGNSTHPAMPSLAGQNADYLVKAMQTYRDKKRQNSMMVAVAEGLSDEAIRRNAIYFATRTPVTVATATRKPTQVGATAFDPLGDGARLAASCNGCHGVNGNSTTPGTPRLAGQQQAFLRAAITHYRDGNRQHAMMQMLTRYLSDTDIEKLALFYASQIPAASMSATPAVTKAAAAGEKLASGCSGCHGEDGNTQDGNIPSLAGQNADYIVAALNAYRSGSRQHSDMKNAAQALDKKAMRQLASYYSQLAPKQSTVRGMESPTVLAQKCNRCHGEGDKKPDADKPRIAGQRQVYLVNALKSYQNKQRINSMMYAMTAELSQVEIEAIAAHYAGASTR
jgi:cytochrome c553